LRLLLACSGAQVLGAVLTMKPTKSDNKDDNEADATHGYAFRIEALKTLNALTENFPKVGGAAKILFPALRFPRGFLSGGLTHSHTHTRSHSHLPASLPPVVLLLAGHLRDG